VTPIRHAIYLHGFASSPASTKARRFGAKLAVAGVTLTCPDFNQPAFETLTMTRMLNQARAAVEAAPARPVALIGSSLGGFVALLVAAAQPPGVDRVVLLAPALDFGGNRLRELGGQSIADWRARGQLTVFHHGDGAPRDVGYALYEDAAAYDAQSVPVTMPTLVFQGRRDRSVDPDMVARWASLRAQVDLRLLDDDHQLTASVEAMWAEMERFFGLTESL
jgi:alpha-beta hydrolase superfamily lysophospholipase